jgi:hypothetical protein
LREKCLIFPSKFPRQQKDEKVQKENHKDETKNIAMLEDLREKGEKKSAIEIPPMT